MTSLLPYNSTQFERDVEASTEYNIDTSIITGFKSNGNYSDELKLALSWEFSLGKINIDNFQQKLIEGFFFHRLRGTPAAVRMALSWENFPSVILEEEPPGVHFHEFQIGLYEIPNDLDAYRLINAAIYGAPLRSRLSRMYNDLYDIRMLVLDENEGEFLDDHSGIRMNPADMNDPKLSFGREHGYAVTIDTPEIISSSEREHVFFAKPDDCFRLDWHVLDDLSLDISNHPMMIEREHTIVNDEPIGAHLPKFLFTYSVFSKALIVLDESVLEDLNCNFSGGYDTSDETPFILDGGERLSECKYTTTRVFIDERFIRDTAAVVDIPFEATVSDILHEREYITAAVLDNTSVGVGFERDTSIDFEYFGNDIWHGHKHFNCAWDEQSRYALIYDPDFSESV
jgi:hypothetical protein